jgi:dolichol kinase
MLGGLAAFLLPVTPYPIALAGSILACVGAFWLKPSLGPWLNSISKPEDRAAGKIPGLRGYAVVVLILILLWPLMLRYDLPAVRYVMFGWMALAFGDGLAGLIGPGPLVARTVPWNRSKTWWGVVGSITGIAAAYLLSFSLFAIHGPPETAQRALVMAPLAALGGALIESLDLPVDDNYVVGLASPLLVLFLHWLIR